MKKFILFLLVSLLASHVAKSQDFGTFHSTWNNNGSHIYSMSIPSPKMDSLWKFPIDNGGYAYMTTRHYIWFPNPENIYPPIYVDSMSECHLDRTSFYPIPLTWRIRQSMQIKSTLLFKVTGLEKKFINSTNVYNVLKFFPKEKKAPFTLLEEKNGKRRSAPIYDLDLGKCNEGQTDIYKLCSDIIKEGGFPCIITDNYIYVLVNDKSENARGFEDLDEHYDFDDPVIEDLFPIFKWNKLQPYISNIDIQNFLEKIGIRYEVVDDEVNSNINYDRFEKAIYGNL